MCECQKATLYPTDFISVRNYRQREKAMTDTVPGEVKGKPGGPAGNEITGELQGFYLWGPSLVLGMAELKPLRGWLSSQEVCCLQLHCVSLLPVATPPSHTQ